jgi:hypothetical protein
VLIREIRGKMVGILFFSKSLTTILGGKIPKSINWSLDSSLETAYPKMASAGMMNDE